MTELMRIQHEHLLQIQHERLGLLQIQLNKYLSIMQFDVRWPCKKHGHLSMLPDLLDLQSELLDEPHNFAEQTSCTSRCLSTI